LGICRLHGGNGKENKKTPFPDPWGEPRKSAHLQLSSVGASHSWAGRAEGGGGQESQCPGRGPGRLPMLSAAPGGGWLAGKSGEVAYSVIVDVAACFFLFFVVMGWCVLPRRRQSWVWGSQPISADLLDFENTETAARVGNISWAVSSSRRLLGVEMWAADRAAGWAGCRAMSCERAFIRHRRVGTKRTSEESLCGTEVSLGDQQSVFLSRGIHPQVQLHRDRFQMWIRCDGRNFLLMGHERRESLDGENEARDGSKAGCTIKGKNTADAVHMHISCSGTKSHFLREGGWLLLISRRTTQLSLAA
jgi:hypothetical protein